MKALAVILGTLIVLIQYPLWVGKGGWMRVWQLDADLSRQQQKSRELEARNAALAADVADLKQGTDAIEERARRDLGMVKGDEIFFQYTDPIRGQSPN